MEIDQAAPEKIKRNRTSPKSGDKGVDELVEMFGKKARVGEGATALTTNAQRTSPKGMTGVENNTRVDEKKTVLDTERAAATFQNAVDELNEQTVIFAQILTILTNFERDVNGFLTKMKKDHQIGMYAYSVMEQNISSVLSGDIRMLRDSVTRIATFPNQLVNQIRDFPKRLQQGIAGVQYHSKPEVYYQRRLAERERLFSDNAQGAYYSPAGLLIKAIGFPTNLIQTDVKIKREDRVPAKIHAFKRMFPNYSFTLLELEFIRRWLNTGKVNFGYNSPYERKFTEKETETEYLPILMDLFGNETFQYFGEEKALSRQARYKQLIEIRAQELRVIDPSLTPASALRRAKNDEE
jgi:hypothetical protein